MKKANPTALGLFLVIGLAFAVGGVILFSSGTLFHPLETFILYFDSSLDGLNPGAPVKFRGVTVGKVDNVLIRHNQASNDFAMPVIIAIDKKLAQSRSDIHLQINPAHMNLLVSHGLRGHLDSESLVTGVLFVELDFVHEPPAPVYHQLGSEYGEIPTVPSQTQQLLASLQRLDLPGLSAKLKALLARVDTKVSELDVTKINNDLTNLLQSANQVVTTPDLTNAIRSAKAALDRAQALVQHVDARVDPLADNLNHTLTDAQSTLADLRGALQHLSGMLASDSSFRSDLDQALEQLSNASRAVGDLAEFLKRDPDALLVGRKKPKE